MTTVNNFIDKISNEQTALLPAVEFRGEIRIVEHERDIAAACKTLAEQPVIGFDTETRPSFRPGVTFRVSLLQLSTPTVCYLFRLNKIPLAKPILQLLEDRREQFGRQRRDGIILDELRAGRGHHHRVEHHVLRVVRGQTVGDHGDELGAGHHADLHRHRRNVFEHRVDLRRKHFRGSVGDHRHAGGVLRGQRRDRGHAEHAVGEHGLQIRLNAGTAGRIRSCDAQYRWQCASHGNSPY